MSEPQVKLFKFDVTGVDPQNLVDGEPHTIASGKKDKMIVPFHGPFYARSVKITQADGTPLKKGTDFQTTYLYPELSARTGKPVTSFIRILNLELSGQLRITYQVVGEGTITGSQAFLDMLTAIQNDERPVNWDNIFNKPATFPPSPHQHDIAYETYNWGGLIDVFSTWQGAMTRRSLVDTGDLYARLRNVDGILRQKVEDVRSYMQAHFQNYNNPHFDTKETVGLGLVDNYATATNEQAIQGTRTDLLLTPSAATALINSRVGGSDSNFVHQGHLRISQYGTLNYLPAGVNGSYEGAGGYSGGQAVRNALIEPDGSLIGLRPGNNGVEQGLYYFHLPSAKKISEGTPIRTNYKYNPAAMNGDIPVFMSRGDAWSALMTKNKSGKYYAVYTNRTLDQTRHDIAQITNIADVGLNSDVAGFATTYVKVIGATWFLFNIKDVTYNTPFDIEIWSVPVASIKANTTVTLTKVTGIKTTDVYNTQVTADAIRLAGRKSSNAAGDNPLVLGTGDVLYVDGPVTHQEMTCVINPNNANQIVLLVTFNVRCAAQGGGGENLQFAGYAIDYDFSTKLASIANNPGRVEFKAVAGSLPTLVNKGGVFPNRGIELFGDTSGLAGYPFPFYADDGFVATISQGQQNDENVLFTTGAITNFTTLYASLRNPTTRQFRANVPVTNDPNVFGSNIGNNLSRPVFFSPTLMYCTTNNNQGDVITTLVEQQGGYKDFTYNVLGVGNVPGFKPTRGRKLTDLTRGIQLITETGPNGTVRVDGSVLRNYVSANGGETSQQAPVTIEAVLGDDGVYHRKDTGSVTWDNSELTALAKSAVASLNMATIADIRITIYVPQNNDLPLIAMVMAVSAVDASTKLFTHGTVVCEIGYTGARNTGKMTGFTVGKILWSLNDNSNLNNGRLVNANNYAPPMGIWKTAAGDYLLGFSHQVLYDIAASTRNYRLRMAVPAGTKTVDVSTVVSEQQLNIVGGVNRDVFPLPGVGLCVLNFENNAASYFSNLIADVKATTLAEFKSWTTKEKTNLVSQQVEQGMIVYFTEETRCFMAGAEWTLPVGSIDLRSVVADPTNKTFYLYVQLDQTGVSYMLSQTEILESLSVMQIGVIKTNGTQISSIAVEKPTLIDGYRISATRRGSAIPVSTGSVNGPGNFAWQ